jgi:hypothetical protein
MQRERERERERYAEEQAKGFQNAVSSQPFKTQSVASHLINRSLKHQERSQKKCSCVAGQCCLAVYAVLFGSFHKHSVLA